MRPAASLAGVERPDFTTTGEFAEWLGVSVAVVDSLAGSTVPEPRRCERGRNYRYRWIQKADGRRRLLEAPKPRLKAVLRRINEAVLSPVPVHLAAHGFVRDRSIKTFLEPHVARDWVLRLDLTDFFPSIPAGRVLNVFRYLGYPELVSRLLTHLCLNRVPGDVLACTAETSDQNGPLCSRQRDQLASAHLPQGAPTSPALANLCLFRLDRRLSGVAVRFQARYTRYADDLVFSGDQTSRRDLPRLRMLVLAILHDEGFSIRRCKSRLMLQGTRQAVCGLRLNERLNVPRETYDHLKAVLHRCLRDGLAEEERLDAEGFRSRLRGLVGYVADINPQRGAKLFAMFHAIDWASLAKG